MIYICLLWTRLIGEVMMSDAKYQNRLSIVRISCPLTRTLMVLRSFFDAYSTRCVVVIVVHSLELQQWWSSSRLQIILC